MDDAYVTFYSKLQFTVSGLNGISVVTRTSNETYPSIQQLTLPSIDVYRPSNRHHTTTCSRSKKRDTFSPPLFPLPPPCFPSEKPLDELLANFIPLYLNCRNLHNESCVCLYIYMLVILISFSSSSFLNHERN